MRSPAPAEQQTDFPVIHSLSGPDSQRRIAYIEDWFLRTRKQDQKHRLKMIRVDGTQDQEIFVRQGSAMWSATAAGDGRIGSQLALAPSGGRVALVTDLESIQMETPPAYLVVGALEIWSLTQKSGRRIAVQALDQATPDSKQLSWFPDEIHLAYVELMAQDRANGALPMEDGFGGGFRLWPRLPAVHVLNVDTGERRFLHFGWTPVVASSGELIAITDLDGRKRMVDAQTGRSVRARYPGLIDPGLIAVLPGRLGLYWGQPTAGQAIQYTNLGSRGPRALVTIKVGEVNSGGFQTLIPYVDAPDPISFGGSNPRAADRGRLNGIQWCSEIPREYRTETGGKQSPSVGWWRRVGNTPCEGSSNPSITQGRFSHDLLQRIPFRPSRSLRWWAGSPNRSVAQEIWQVRFGRYNAKSSDVKFHPRRPNGAFSSCDWLVSRIAFRCQLQDGRSLAQHPMHDWFRWTTRRQDP